MKEQTDFLDEMAPEPVEDTQPAPAPVETSTPPEAATDSGQPRAKDGTFAPKKKSEKGDTPPTTAETFEEKVEEFVAEGSEPPSDTNEAGNVPVAALQAERRKRQALEAELAKLRKPDDAQQSQQTPTAPEFIPPQVDFRENPQAYVEAHLLNERLNTSRHFANEKYGEEKVNTAWNVFDKAAETDAAAHALSVRLRSHPHPIGEIVKWYDQQQELNQIREAGSVQALVERMVAERMAAMQQQGVAPAAASTFAASPPAQKPPPSLARGAGAASGPELVPEEEEFEAFFNKR